MSGYPCVATTSIKQSDFVKIRNQRGLTFVELLVIVVMSAILAMVAVPAFFESAPDCSNPNARQDPMLRSKIARVTGQIGEIHMAATRFELSRGRYPASLAEIGMDELRDPWGNPYQYFVVFGNENAGKVRKDHNLHPVNSGYDVYSMGPDGVTASPFTSTLGKDDIVMANDGDFFGLACQYNGSGKN